MLSISSIFSAISSNISALRKAPDISVPGRSIAKRSDAVDDVVSLSSQGIKAADRAQTEISSRPTEQKSAPSIAKPDKDQQIQQTDGAMRAQAHIATSGGLVRNNATFGQPRVPEESIERARASHTATLAPAAPSPQDRPMAAQATRLEAETRQEFTWQPITPAPEMISLPPSGKSDNPIVHHGLAVYQEMSNILDQKKPTSSFRISA